MNQSCRESADRMLATTLHLYGFLTMMKMAFATRKFVYLKYYIDGFSRHICHIYSRQI